MSSTASRELLTVDEDDSSSLSDSQFHSALNVSVALTEQGVSRVEKIVESVFGYIRLIKNYGVKKWIFDEADQLSNIKFHFRERDDHAMVRKVSDKMIGISSVSCIIRPSSVSRLQTTGNSSNS